MSFIKNGGCLPQAHVRSPEAIARREALRNHTYRDYELAETVCIMPFDYVAEFYSVQHNEFVQETVGVERGEVMADSRGRGTFQK